MAISLAVLAAGLTGACGASHQGTDGGAPDTRVDTPRVEGGFPDLVRDTGRDAPPNIEPGAGSVLLVPGNAKLVGGSSGCTNEEPAKGDRWCAIARPSTFLGNSDLWVLNVTQALAGRKVLCNGNDPSCIRLSTDLYGDLTMHGFVGDTLLFYADNNSNGNFVGTVFAWRPGWREPRPLTSQLGLFCTVHPTVLSAMCIQNPFTDPDTDLFTLDVVAGKLDIAGDNGPLPLVDTILYAAPDDPMNVNKVNFELSPAGDAVLWSARATPKGTEILHMQTLNAPATKRIVAQDAAQWTVTRDSSTWYWLSGFNYSQNGGASGTLQMAPYPSGAAPSLVMPMVGDFTAAGNKTVVVRSNLFRGTGDLKVIGDVRDVAGTTKKLDGGVLALWTISRDGNTAMYSKASDSAGQLVDMFLGSTTKAMPCSLSTTPVAFGFGNLAEPSMTAAWVKVVDNSNNNGAFTTKLDTCASKMFATNIITLDRIADQGYVYMDEASDTGDEGTLRFNQVVAGQLGATGQVIQKRALPASAVLWPAHPAVVYSIGTKGSTDGLYINNKLPFTDLLPPPGTDAGVPPADAGPDTLPPIPDALPPVPDGAIETAPDAGSKDVVSPDAGG